jgi:hypothetical protein
LQTIKNQKYAPGAKKHIFITFIEVAMKYCLFLLCCSSLIAQDSFSTHFQFFHNKSLGTDFALAAIGEEVIFQGTSSQSLFHHWRITQFNAAGALQFTNAGYGEQFGFEPRNIDEVWRLRRIPVGFVTGQAWVLSTENGTDYTISTEWQGPDLVLTQSEDAEGNPEVIWAANEGGDQQLWNFTPIQPRETFPSITAPEFITRENFWSPSPLSLAVLLPHPNTDGNDTFSFETWAYDLRITSTEDNSVIHEEEIISDTWPVYREYQILNADYEVSIKRRGTSFRLHASPAVLYSGAFLRGNDPEPTTTRGYDLWLLHLPKISGGFSAQVEFHNQTPTNTNLVMAGFLEDGTRMDPIALFLGSNEKLSRPLYGQDGLFPQANLTDQISHIGFFQPNRNIDINLLTTAINTGFGVWSSAVDIRQGESSGNVIELNGTIPGENYYLGAAILNLIDLGAVTIFADQINPETNEVVETIELGSLQPGAKLLSVPTLRFQQSFTSAQIRIRNGTNTNPIQVFGLNGIISGEFIGPARTIPLLQE